MTTDAPAPAIAPAALAHQQAVRSFGRAVRTRLMLWSVLTVAIGALLLRRGGRVWRGFGVQSLGWGRSMPSIAGSGLLADIGRLKRLRVAIPNAPHASCACSLFNAGLNVGYMAWASSSPTPRAARDTSSRGQGWGIVVQGAFLFLFDLYHALRVPRGGEPAGRHCRGNTACAIVSLP